LIAPARAAILACIAASSAMLESNASQYHSYGYHLMSNLSGLLLVLRVVVVGVDGTKRDRS
jgi:divalent metal cation (Fe/Co/Zn/Cd) transporter